ncbi:MAG: MarR family winged helix-turn-helix transcriptional regulator [Candidatus Acidiferrales bacterium]
MPDPKLQFDPIAEAHGRWLERWPEADRMAAATAVVRVSRIVTAAVETGLTPLGLTFARYEALVLLTFTRKGRLPLGKMGARLQVHPTSVTNTVDRLESQGFVRRVADPADRRTILAEITEEGRAVVERATSAVLATKFGLAMLQERQLENLLEILLRIREASGDFEPIGNAPALQPSGW